MLTAATSVKSSGAYVAIERVTGSLHGRTGSFVLQHVGTMTRGVPQLSISVVPDSGTGQLAGLTGKFLVIIADGKHSNEFDYSLPETGNWSVNSSHEKAFWESKPAVCDSLLKLIIMAACPARGDILHASDDEITRGLGLHS